eukprot:gene41916-56765_t
MVPGAAGELCVADIERFEASIAWSNPSRSPFAAWKSHAPRAFEGRMAAGGAAVILPDDAAALAAGPWQSMQRLQIAVKDGDTVIRGSVALDGLGQAYSNLVNNCGQ